MSAGWLLFLIWLALQVFSVWRRRKQGPPPPPGGRVKAVHNEEEWKEHQKTAALADSKLLVVDFSATWCPPCRAITPFYEALSEKYPQATFVKVDVDEAKGVAGSCGVRAMPTFHLYKAGKLVEQWAGADERRLEAATAKWVQ
jgi:thioredoxin 1